MQYYVILKKVIPQIQRTSWLNGNIKLPAPLLLCPLNIGKLPLKDFKNYKLVSLFGLIITFAPLSRLCKKPPNRYMQTAVLKILKEMIKLLLFKKYLDSKIQMNSRKLKKNMNNTIPKDQQILLWREISLTRLIYSRRQKREAQISFAVCQTLQLEILRISQLITHRIINIQLCLMKDRRFLRQLVIIWLLERFQQYTFNQLDQEML